MNIRVLVGLLLCCGSLPMFAAEVLGGISGRYEHSNNILQVQSGEQDEDMLIPRVDLTLVEESGRVQGSGILYVEHVDYRNDLAADETRYGLTTAWSASIIENRLMWVLEDAAGRRLVDSRELDIAENRSDQNQLVTGPDLTFSAGARDELTLSARYGNSWYGDALSFDNQRYTGRAHILHRLSPISSIGAHVEHGRTEFLRDQVADFDRDEVAIELSRGVTRSQIRLELGYNRVTPEEGDGYEGSLGIVSWRQQWKRSFFSELRGDWRLTDTGLEAISNAVEGGVDIDFVVSNDIYQLNSVSFISGWKSSRWSADLTVRAETQDYKVQPLDQEITAVEVGVSREISQQTTLNLYGDGSRSKFLGAGRVDREFELNLSVDHIFSNLFYGAVGGSYGGRNSNAVDADFRETIVFVEFGLRGTLLARERGRELRRDGQVGY
ncbi:MAG: hypothetical protein P1U67_11450 [Alcanivoracaceae bacterium]|nr:hypothetical protein [Alcanivoracaceae bacterium]